MTNRIRLVAAEIMAGHGYQKKDPVLKQTLKLKVSPNDGTSIKLNQITITALGDDAIEELGAMFPDLEQDKEYVLQITPAEAEAEDETPDDDTE